MPKPARTTVLPLPKGFQARPRRGCGRNLALFLANAFLPMWGCVKRAPFGPKTKLAARESTSVHPLEVSWRKPRESVNLGLKRMTSSAYRAPNQERQPSGVGVGSKRNVPMEPCRNVCRPVKVAWPNWLRAKPELDCIDCDHAPRVNCWRPCVIESLSS